RVRKVTLCWNCLCWLVSLLGAFFAYRARSELATPFASVMLMCPVVFYVAHTSGRYRDPMDPIMTILTVFAIAFPLSQLLRRGQALSASVGYTRIVSIRGDEAATND